MTPFDKQSTKLTQKQLYEKRLLLHPLHQHPPLRSPAQLTRKIQLQSTTLLLPIHVAKNMKSV